jgi:hypothetical protein
VIFGVTTVSSPHVIFGVHMPIAASTYKTEVLRMNVGNDAPDIKCLLSLCTREGHSLCCIVAAYIGSVLSACLIFITNFVFIIISKNIDLEDSGIIYLKKKKDKLSVKCLD